MPTWAADGEALRESAAMRSGTRVRMEGTERGNSSEGVKENVVTGNGVESNRV